MKPLKDMTEFELKCIHAQLLDSRARLTDEEDHVKYNLDSLRMGRVQHLFERIRLIIAAQECDFQVELLQRDQYKFGYLRKEK